LRSIHNSGSAHHQKILQHQAQASKVFSWIMIISNKLSY
jgi:hypothetical protein